MRLIVGMLVLAVGPSVARAQWTVFDPTNYAENVAHYLRTLDQIRLAQAQISNQIQALRRLASPDFRHVGSVVAAATAAAGRTGTVGYATPDLDQRFATAYPGVATTRDYPAAQRAASAQTLATIAGSLDATRAGAATVTPGVAQLERFKAQAAATTGHEEALELANTVHVYSAEELVMMRQAMSAQTNGQAAYFAHEVSADAESQENARALWTGMASTPPRRATLVYGQP